MKVKLTRRLGQNKPGTVLDLTTPEAEFLVYRGHAEPVEEHGKTSGTRATTTAQSDDEQDDDLDSLTLSELKDRATEAGVATYGTKAEIADRIRTAPTVTDSND